MNTHEISGEDLFASITITKLLFKPFDGLDLKGIIELSKPRSPSDWFSYHFPKEARQYGPPMLLKQLTIPGISTKEIPLNLNIDFFAGMLQNEICNSTVYHELEQWYQKDKETGYFVPVTDEHLKLTLSQWFIKCIQDMSSSIDIAPIFNQFRDDDINAKILRRAKAILAVDDSIFDPESNNKRNPATMPQESVRLFVDQMLVACEENVITLHDCFLGYQEFCKENKLAGVRKNQFRSAAAPHIQRRFQLGMRHDLTRFEADRCAGWKGIKVRDDQV